MGSKRVAPPTLKKIFKSVFPYYLSIGMTYDQFWNDDVCLVQDYREAHEINRRRKNEELWLQGGYFHDAIGVVLANAFSKGEKSRYPERPYPLTQKDVQEREVEQLRKNAEAFRMLVEAKEVEKELKEADNGRND